MINVMVKHVFLVNVMVKHIGVPSRIDWHDFVIVETIEFTAEDDSLQLAPPIDPATHAPKGAPAPLEQAGTMFAEAKIEKPKAEEEVQEESAPPNVDLEKEEREKRERELAEQREMREREEREREEREREEERERQEREADEMIEEEPLDMEPEIPLPMQVLGVGGSGPAFVLRCNTYLHDKIN